MEEFYRQCQFEQGDTRQVAWIPERGAKVGVELELKGDEGLWKVVSVGPLRIDEETAKSFRDAYRTQRDASDI